MEKSPSVLVINNYLKPEKIDELLSAISPFALYEVIPFHQVKTDYEIRPNIKAVVLSGSEARIVNNEDRSRYSGVSQLIENVDLPLLGICYGHQLMCLTHGAEVDVLENSAMDFFESVRLLIDDPIFKGFRVGEDLSLAETHNDYVKKKSLSQAGLVLLADSSSCEVEAVKHMIKPFYGVQFHPEKTQIKDQQKKEGLKIISNFCRFLKSENT